MLKNTKKNLKRKLSYNLSFRSEAAMLDAIKSLKSTDLGDGFDFDVSAVIAESPIKVSGGAESEGDQAPQEVMSDLIVEDYDDEFAATGSRTSSCKS